MSEQPPETLSPGTIAAAAILPAVGLIIAIVLFAKGRGSHGAAVLLTSLVSAAIAIAVLAP